MHRRSRVAVGIAFGLSLYSPGLVRAQTPELRVADAWVLEGDTGTTTLRFRVTLSVPSDGTVVVGYATADGTAHAGSGDYMPAIGGLAFPLGATEDSILVTVVGDTLVEANETVCLDLFEPAGVILATDRAFGHIRNDDRTVFTPVNAGFPIYSIGATLPVAWGDYDGDGLQDLPLYHGQFGYRFTEIPNVRSALANGNYHGAAWCDYDRDGRSDFVIQPYPNPPYGATRFHLFHNLGLAGLIDVAPSLGMDVNGFGETPVWGDFDADGWPDLFTPYYAHVAPFRSFLYRNNGDGTFTERAAAAGVALMGLALDARPEGAAAADWNGDGTLDLYCAHHLFLNDGNGNFVDVLAAVGLPVLFDEGSSFVDFDNDGDLDLYLRGTETPRLFRNDGGTFLEVTTAAGLTPVVPFWGDSWADVDNDGDLDLLLFVGDGHPRLMLNRGDGTFARDLEFETFDLPSALSAWADIDHDGDVDVVVGDYEKSLVLNRLEMVPQEGDRHLNVRVLDAQGYETEHGSTVRLIDLDGGEGTTQTRVVDGGSGYLAQNEYTVHFGGLGTSRYALEVVYPSPAGHKVVVDSTMNRVLGPFTPASLGGRDVAIYRNGFVQVGFPPAAGISDSKAETDWTATVTPVPARVSAELSFTLPAAGRVEITAFDLQGRTVRELPSGSSSTGVGTARWKLDDDRGQPVPEGVYFLRLRLDGRTLGVRRVVVLR